MPDGLRIAIGLGIIFFALGLASVRVKFLVNLALHGRRDPERFRNIPKRLGAELVEVMGQKKLLQWTVPGALHALTYWGFLIIQLTLIESIGELFDDDFKIPLVAGSWVGNVLGAVEDSFFLLVTFALAGFTLIRIANSPKRKGRKSRFYGSHLGAAYIVLLMIFNVVWTVALARACRAALHGFPYDGAYLSNWLGDRVSGWSESTLSWVGSSALLLHMAVVFGFLILVLNSKHMHIFTSPLNVLFGRHPRALGPLRPIEIDMENLTEDTVFGVGKVEDFTWKQVLDMYTCTECGRCSSVCPAWNTEKPLNPKFIITDSRDHLFEKAPWILGKKVWEMDTDDVSHPMNAKLVGDVHDPESIWACTTCGACVYECPVDIEHVDQILDMRRNLVMMESSFPPEAGLMMRNLENSGNPWGASNSQRLDWAKGLEDYIPIVNGRMPTDAEYLYWVGCAGAFDDRASKSVRAFAELMLAANVTFAVLGPQESCTGDPARRIGNEYLFQEIAKANIATLNGKGVRKIVASCPHCFNTIAREYPQFGGTYEVIHHSQLLDRLVADGRLRLTKDLEEKIAYHDPCYLARHNDVIEEPRRAINEIPSVTTVEAGRCKRGTFCCGAGGARMWMEETAGQRVNVVRTEELLGTDASVLATACPFCTIMLDDAAKALSADGKSSGDVAVLDVSQLLRQSVDPSQLTFLRAGAPTGG